MGNGVRVQGRRILPPRSSEDPVRNEERYRAVVDQELADLSERITTLNLELKKALARIEALEGP